MMPLCDFRSAALISGITSGTESSIRNALELSTTTQPALAAIGANSFEMLPPALNRAMSTPSNDFGVNSCTAISFGPALTFLPADRAEASNVNFPTGKPRRSRVLIISAPTAPVAPTTATCRLRFINYAKGQILYADRAWRVKPTAVVFTLDVPSGTIVNDRLVTNF